MLESRKHKTGIFTDKSYKLSLQIYFFLKVLRSISFKEFLSNKKSISFLRILLRKYKKHNSLTQKSS